MCPFAGPSLAEAAERGRDFRFTELTPELLDEMDRNEWELFDLGADPREQTPLAPSATQVEAAAAASQDALGPAPEAAAPASNDALRALGYVQ
mgnify:CR=1 FL=1